MTEELADTRLGAHVLGALVRPRATFEALSTERSARPGASAIALLGIFWTALSVSLWIGGRAPAFVLLPIAPDLYYLAQGFFVLPLLTALWWVHSEIAHRLCRAAGGEGDESGVRAALGFAYAAPMLVHVLVELGVYAALGFDALSAIARVSLPVASLWVWALSALALRLAHRVSVPIAIGAAFVGLFVQAAIGGLILR